MEKIPISAPQDQDLDSLNDLLELQSSFLNPLDGSDAFDDADGDGVTNVEEINDGSDPLRRDRLTRILNTSPGIGEQGTAVTRETIIRLSQPLTETIELNRQSVISRFAGKILTGRLHLSAERDVVTLFYDEPLPPSARILCTVNGNQLIDREGEMVDADNDGQAGGIYQFEFDTLGLTIVPGTAVCGRVFASEWVRAPGGSISVNEPLAGVVITVDGRESELRAETDSQGNFRLEPCPAGRFFVHIDGRNAVVDGLPD
ncbi:MAG: hypothetical protein AAF514_20200, partial [Verrucomicrobiota bacterium]